MITWSPESEKRLEEVIGRFRSALRALSETLAIRDSASVITDANVEEAAGSIMRGHRRPLEKAIRIGLGVVEFVGGALSGSAIMIWGSLATKEPLAANWVAWVFFCAGLVLFVLGKCF